MIRERIRRYRPSVRLLVAVGVLLPTLTAAAVLIAVSTFATRGIAQQLGQSVLNEASQSVHDHVINYLDEAMRVAEAYSSRLRRGLLPTENLVAWEPYLFDDLIAHPRVASICFGNTAGDATWLLRNDQRLELGRVDGHHDGYAVEHEVSAHGQILDEPLRVYSYDPRLRPWYDVGLGSDEGRWTPIYFWFGDTGKDATTGTGFARAVRDDLGRIRGVLVIDVTLRDMSQFLAHLPIKGQGFIFVVDDQGLLVAASDGEVTSDEGHRLTLAQSASPAATAAAHVLEQAGEGHHDPDRMLHVDTGRGLAGAMVLPLRPYPGIDWQIVTLLPESAFLSDAQRLARHSLIIGLIATVAALLFGLFQAQRIARPLLTLTEHVRRIGRGDFAGRVQLQHARELLELSNAMNRMTVDLHRHLELQHAVELAKQVQQALLPDADPTVPGLDVAGRSRYCDAMGGDYYDFITIDRPDGPALLTVIGDVMGHGVAAALLMASARAVLRAHIDPQVNLAQLLRLANHALGSDARHQQFMTLALVLVAPGSRTIRWASAGHDPAILYLPGDDRFEELDGGELPLCVLETVHYKSYERATPPRGAVLVLGTDGIWETRDADGDWFGKQRLRQVIREHHDQSAAHIAAAIEARLNAFRSLAPVLDDATFIVIRFT